MKLLAWPGHGSREVRNSFQVRCGGSALCFTQLTAHFTDFPVHCAGSLWRSQRICDTRNEGRSRTLPSYPLFFPFFLFFLSLQDCTNRTLCTWKRLQVGSWTAESLYLCGIEKYYENERRCCMMLLKFNCRKNEGKARPEALGRSYNDGVKLYSGQKEVQNQTGL